MLKFKNPIHGVQTVHLYEGTDTLAADISDRYGQISESVKYENVYYVTTEPGSFGDGKKTTVRVEASDSHLIVPFGTEMEASAVADYVGKRCKLTLIVGAWRVRRPFECPVEVGPSCAQFKELLDHDDKEIVDFYYQQGTKQRGYACFNTDDSGRFFLLGYSNFGHFGVLSRSVFEAGQATNSDVRNIRWSGEVGTITTNERKAHVLGFLDTSSLLYHTIYPNVMGTTTEYSLSVRWSTGRYTEKSTGQDAKGIPFYYEASGTCIKIH